MAAYMAEESLTQKCLKNTRKAFAEPFKSFLFFSDAWTPTTKADVLRLCRLRTEGFTATKKLFVETDGNSIRFCFTKQFTDAEAVETELTFQRDGAVGWRQVMYADSSLR